MGIGDHFTAQDARRARPHGRAVPPSITPERRPKAERMTVHIYHEADGDTTSRPFSAKKWGGWDSNPHGAPPEDFKSPASASSATAPYMNGILFPTHKLYHETAVWGNSPPEQGNWTLDKRPFALSRKEEARKRERARAVKAHRGGPPSPVAQATPIPEPPACRGWHPSCAVTETVST